MASPWAGSTVGSNATTAATTGMASSSAPTWSVGSGPTVPYKGWSPQPITTYYNNKSRPWAPSAAAASGGSAAPTQRYQFRHPNPSELNPMLVPLPRPPPLSTDSSTAFTGGQRHQMTLQQFANNAAALLERKDKLFGPSGAEKAEKAKQMPVSFIPSTVSEVEASLKLGDQSRFTSFKMLSIGRFEEDIESARDRVHRLTQNQATQKDEVVPIETEPPKFMLSKESEFDPVFFARSLEYFDSNPTPPVSVLSATTGHHVVVGDGLELAVVAGLMVKRLEFVSYADCHHREWATMTRATHPSIPSSRDLLWTYMVPMMWQLSAAAEDEPRSESIVRHTMNAMLRAEARATVPLPTIAGLSTLCMTKAGWLLEDGWEERSSVAEVFCGGESYNMLRQADRELLFSACQFDSHVAALVRSAALLAHKRLSQARAEVSSGPIDAACEEWTGLFKSVDMWASETLGAAEYSRAVSAPLTKFWSALNGPPFGLVGSALASQLAPRVGGGGGDPPAAEAAANDQRPSSPPHIPVQSLSPAFESAFVIPECYVVALGALESILGIASVRSAGSNTNAAAVTSVATTLSPWDAAIVKARDRMEADGLTVVAVASVRCPSSAADNLAWGDHFLPFATSSPCASPKASNRPQQQPRAPSPLAAGRSSPHPQDAIHHQMDEKEFWNRLRYLGNWQILGLFAIKQPLRANLRECVRHCTEHGINLVVSTSDSIGAATILAQRMGLTSSAARQQRLASQPPAFPSPPATALNLSGISLGSLNTSATTISQLNSSAAVAKAGIGNGLVPPLVILSGEELALHSSLEWQTWIAAGVHVVVARCSATHQVDCTSSPSLCSSQPGPKVGAESKGLLSHLQSMVLAQLDSIRQTALAAAILPPPLPPPAATGVGMRPLIPSAPVSATSSSSTAASSSAVFSYGAVSRFCGQSDKRPAIVFASTVFNAIRDTMVGDMTIRYGGLPALVNALLFIRSCVAQFFPSMTSGTTSSSSNTTTTTRKRRVMGSTANTSPSAAAANEPAATASGSSGPMPIQPFYSSTKKRLYRLLNEQETMMAKMREHQFCSDVEVTFLQFNDMHQTSEFKTEPVGGVARLATAIQRELEANGPNTFVVFSGDALAPSITATVMKGSHAIPILNGIGVQCAVVGNHDWDWGVDRFTKLTRQSNFKWLLSNVVGEGGNQIDGTHPYHILEGERGLRIGVIGIIERDWLLTVASLPEYIHYIDMYSRASSLARFLKECHMVSMVVALTHMRVANDQSLAEKVPYVDLILGGHDHETTIERWNGIHIVKAGSDCRKLSVVKCTIPANRRIAPHRGASAVGLEQPLKVQVKHVPITAELEKRPDVLALIQENEEQVMKRLGNVVCHTRTDLDVRSASARTGELAVGNFITDVLRGAFAHVKCDVAILQGGCMRANRIFPPGPLTLRDILEIIPIEDQLVVLEIKGSVLWDAIEGGISKYPQHDGRFPQVSGIKFAFKGSEPPGKRLQSMLIAEGPMDNPTWEPLDRDRLYRLATSEYLSKGKDGYAALLQADQVVVNGEDGGILPTILRNYFVVKKTLQRIKSLGGTSSLPTRLLLRTTRRSLKADDVVIPFCLEGRITIEQ